MTEITFRVPDMSCAHCKAAVEDELNRLPGVVSSNADLEKECSWLRRDLR
jgi:copper chaperone